MSKVRDLHKQCSRDPDYQAAYESLGPEFELARLLIGTRADTEAARTEPTQPDMLRLPREGP